MYRRKARNFFRIFFHASSVTCPRVVAFACVFVDKIFIEFFLSLFLSSSHLFVSKITRIEVHEGRGFVGIVRLSSCITLTWSFFSFPCDQVSGNKVDSLAGERSERAFRSALALYAVSSKFGVTRFWHRTSVKVYAVVFYHTINRIIVYLNILGGC